LLTLLQNYHFPGNIRELESMVYAAVTRHKKGILSLDVFWEKIRNSDQNNTYTNNEGFISEGRKITFSGTLPTFAELEEIYLNEVMRLSEDNKSIAAKLSGLQRKTLAYRLQKLEKKRD
jgi:DNA-binding NtrC family response regulator